MMERQYKDSGIEWIGRIPEGWETQRGKTLGDISHGVSFTPSDLRDKDEGVLILRASNVQNSQLDYQDNVYIPKSKIPIEKLLKKDDIVICGTNGSLALVGKSALVKEDMEASYGSFMLRMRTKKEPRFIHYQLTQIVDMYRGLFATTTINQLTISQLQNIIFVIPPLPEQQRIASYLDKKCGEIDALIAMQEKMIAQLTEYKQAVITEAVTKGLDPNAKLVPSGIEWIGDVPEGWRVVPIKFLKSSVKNAFVDGPFGSNLKSEHFIVGGDILVIESGFITTGKFIFKEFKTISSEHFETIRRSECRAHDVIIAKIGANYGMAGELPELGKPAVVSGNSLKITLDNSKILNSIFVYLMMTSKHNHGFIDLVQENAQPALSLSGLNNFKLPVPPLPEQHSIAAYLDAKCSEIDALIALKRQKIESLNAYKKSVIYEAVTGKTII